MIKKKPIFFNLSDTLESHYPRKYIFFDWLCTQIERIPKPLLIGIVVSFVVTFFVFLTEVSNFSYWDHDFAYLKSFSTNVNYTDGRWAADFLNVLIGFEFIPFVSFFWATLFKVSSGVLAAYFWTKNKDIPLLICSGILVGISPEGLSYVLYRFQSQMFSGAMFFCVIGFLFAEQEHFILAFVSFLISIGTHQTILNMIGVLFCGKIIFDLINKKFFISFKFYKAIVCIVGIACATNFLIILILKKISFIHDHYNNIASLKCMKDSVVPLVKACFVYFWPFNNAAYMPFEVKIAILVLASIAIFIIISSTLRGKILSLKGLCLLGFNFIAFFSLIVSAKISMILTPIKAYHAYRLTANGSIFLCLFIVVITMLYAKNIHISILVQLFVIFILYEFFVQDALFQRRNNDQFMADLSFAQRIVGGIENLDGFDIKKTYNFIFVGTMPYVERKFYVKYNYAYSLEEFSRNTMMKWSPTAILSYLAPYLKISTQITSLVDINDPILAWKVYNYSKKYPWPNKKFAMFINDSTILVILDNTNLDLEAQTIKQKLIKLGYNINEIPPL